MVFKCVYIPITYINIICICICVFEPVNSLYCLRNQNATISKLRTCARNTDASQNYFIHTWMSFTMPYSITVYARMYEMCILRALYKYTCVRWVRCPFKLSNLLTWIYAQLHRIILQKNPSVAPLYHHFFQTSDTFCGRLIWFNFAWIMFMR